MVSGAESWEDIEIYGESKAELLREFLPYRRGFPDESTLHRVFSRLDSEKFRDCFISFVSSLFPQAGERLILKLLDLIDLNGAIVSIDAASCQKHVSEKIVDGGGNDVLGLKGNQGSLHGCAKALFVR